MNLKARVLGLVLISALSAPVLHAQISGLYTDGMGAAKDPTQKAADAYSRGMQMKRKADAATDPAKKAKLYEKAKKELERSAGLRGQRRRLPGPRPDRSRPGRRASGTDQLLSRPVAEVRQPRGRKLHGLGPDHGSEGAPEAGGDAGAVAFLSSGVTGIASSVTAPADAAVGGEPIIGREKKAGGTPALPGGLASPVCLQGERASPRRAGLLSQAPWERWRPAGFFLLPSSTPIYPVYEPSLLQEPPADRLPENDPAAFHNC